jgi:tetratricopeptide (TPR) repeat protein
MADPIVPHTEFPHRALALPGVFVALLILISLAVYGRVCGHRFLAWDDPQNVVNNRRVDPPTWRGVAESWRRPYWGLYIPVAYTFFSAEAAVAYRPATEGEAASLSPAVFHAGNLALHVVCVLLAYAVLRRSLRRQGPEATAAGLPGPLAHEGAAFAGALWFSLHPMQVESVAWISETRGLLCAMFSLLAVRQYLKHAENWSGHSIVHYLLATLWFALALLSKPAAVAVPLLAAALDVGLLRRPARRTLADLGPWLAVAVCVATATRSLQAGGAVPAAAPLWTRPLVAGEAILFYVVKTLVPWRLSADYGCTPEWMMRQAWFPWAWLVPLVLLGGLAWGKGRRAGLTCAAVFVFWLVPVLGFVPFDFQRISIVADRYVYLALLGPALGLAWLLKRYWGPWAIGVGGIVLAVYAALGFAQAAYWHDTGTLFAQVLDVNSRSVVARFHLGLLAAQSEGHDDEAIHQFREALAERPDLVEIHIALANTLLRSGQVGEAREVLEGAVWRFPQSVVVRNSFANVLARQEGDDEADRQYREAIRIQPNFAEAHRGLGRLRLRQKAYPAAVEHFRKVLELVPDSAEARIDLGATMEAMGDRDEAKRLYLAALKVHPRLPTAHFNLGNLLLHEPGGLTEAVAHYREAIQYDPFYAEGYVNLGIALRLQGRTAEAIQMQRAALSLNPRLVEGHVQLGLSLAAEGKRAEAADALRAALSHVPADSESARKIRELLEQGAKRTTPQP